MTEPETQIEEVIRRESELVQELMALEKRLKKGETLGRDATRLQLRGLLQRAEELSDDVTPIFLDAPITCLNHARFGWAVYEIANARLNIQSLLLFGVNQVTARREGRVPGEGGIPSLYIEALLSDKAKAAVAKRLKDGSPARPVSDEEWAGLVINSARDAADEMLKGERQ